MLPYSPQFCNVFPASPTYAWQGSRAAWRALRPLLLGLVWCGLWAGSAACWRACGPLLLLNLTPSVPRGLYLVTPCPTVTRGMLVVVPPPASVAALLVARGYLAPQTPLLKPVAALAGDEVCIDDTGVRINGVWMTHVDTADTSGRPLPSWQGCVTLPEGEVFLLSTWHAHSLDSRYFGPVPVAQLLGKATPVWTRGGDGTWSEEAQRGKIPGRQRPGVHSPFALEIQHDTATRRLVGLAGVQP
jgi:conjugative transfer signal peptidase TraF